VLTEQVWRLPGSFLCYNYGWRTRRRSPPAVRANGFVTFGCFGSGGIGDDIIAIWARISRGSKSRLYIGTSSAGYRASCRTSAGATGCFGRVILDRDRRADLLRSATTWTSAWTRGRVPEEHRRRIAVAGRAGGDAEGHALCQPVWRVVVDGGRMPRARRRDADECVEIAVALAQSPERLDYTGNLRSMARGMASDAGAAPCVEATSP
jgi:hypothetical protein